MRRRRGGFKVLPGSMTPQERRLTQVRLVTATVCAVGVLETTCLADGPCPEGDAKPINTDIDRIGTFLLSAPSGLAEC